MFKNYLVTALNNLLKNRLYSMINIVGLAVGLMACILITLYVQDELSYDEQWEKSGQIHRIIQEMELPGSVLTRDGFTSLPVLSNLMNFFPSDIEAGTRLRFEPMVNVVVDGIGHTEQFVRVDRDFSKLFQLDVVSGSLEATFTNVNSIALNEEQATRLFGDADPIGQTITIPSRYVFPARDYIVTAVYRFPVGNSVLDNNTMFSLSSSGLVLLDDSNLPGLANSWHNNSLQTYVLLRDGVDKDVIDSQLPDFVDTHANLREEAVGTGTPSDFIRFSLQPITDLYLNPWSELDRQNSGSSVTVLIFAVIAALVLVIGCTNFIVLTTAKSTNRCKEVAMRKVMGARREALVVQFLGEAVLITVFAILLGLVLLELALPVYSAFAGKELALNYGSPITYLFLMGLVLIVGVIGGVYPALVLSGYSPAKSLQAGRGQAAGGSVNARNLLVIFQFSVSVALLVATALVFLQTQFASTANLGFRQDNLLVVGPILPAASPNEVLQQEINQLGNVVSSSLSYSRPGQGFTGGDGIGQSLTVLPRPESGIDTSLSVSLRTNPVDTNFFDIYDIPIIAGRNYDEGFLNDRIARNNTNGEQQTTQANVIINEAAVRHLGLASPQNAIGLVLQGNYSFSRSRMPIIFTVVGVAADSLFLNVRTESLPEMYPLDPLLVTGLTVRFEGDPQQVLSSIAAIWPTVMGSGVVLNAEFVDQLITIQMADVQVQSIMLAGFSLLTLVISCLGLLGMSTFIIDRRTREIGLRKVMGAKIKDIVRLLVWQFSKPVLLANLIAWPFIVWVMMRWLETFSNHIDSLWLLPLCLAAGVISLLFMWITVAGNTTLIARRSPIHALRYE
ncbi:MAG: hypothetical protein COB20_12825 [SAR86 cluster bacterium]|uniref:ABC transporter permease n=1 Tax=SAR86 cluster bacterium TaxID=2030880 RepID=A0A2A4X067_9GAMM|nr:MAG: hypothetical protein COB20_12825 [SAR86 cluster bacterium]